jgi:hypothetical protein
VGSILCVTLQPLSGTWNHFIFPSNLPLHSNDIKTRTQLFSDMGRSSSTEPGRTGKKMLANGTEDSAPKRPFDSVLKEKLKKKNEEACRGISFAKSENGNRDCPRAAS